MANLTHIAPLSATLGLVVGASARLVDSGLLVIYGPFNEARGFTGPGSAVFDANLRKWNPNWGLRDRKAGDATALAHMVVVEPLHETPANSWLLAYRQP